MKSVFALMLVTLSLGASAQELLKSDYAKIKSMVLENASQSMLKSGSISEALRPYSLYSIKVTLDIVQTEEAASVFAQIMPAEDNCNCQDIFEATMEANKTGSYWEMVEGSLKVKHIQIDH